MPKLLLQLIDVGLGDVVSFGIVLKHLKHFYPDTEIGIECNAGKEACFRGLADYVYPLVHPFYWRKDWPKPKSLIFQRPEHFQCEGVPTTKPTRCLYDEFKICTQGVWPIEELYRYEFTVSPEAQAKAERYHEQELQGEPFALVHYQGVSSPDDKNLTHDEAETLCRAITDCGLRPVLLDWFKSSPLPAKGITCPGRTHWLWGSSRAPNVDNLAALIERAEVFYGIDSGPEHLAGALKTPTVIYWTNNHPALCYDLADNVTHFLPPESRELVPFPEVLDYFHSNYRHEYYGEQNESQQD